jgi:hypothetical protein
LVGSSLRYFVERFVDGVDVDGGKPGSDPNFSDRNPVVEVREVLLTIKAGLRRWLNPVFDEHRGSKGDEALIMSVYDCTELGLM